MQHCCRPGVRPSGRGRSLAAHARALPSYVLKALALAHPDDPNVLDNEQGWQRAHLPEGFTDFVDPAG
jgi:hypothetical protein